MEITGADRPADDPSVTVISPPAPPMTSRVDAFEENLVPFLGDPESSKSLGRANQVAGGILVVFHLARAGLWMLFATIARDAVDGGFATSQVKARLVSVGHVVDSLTALFWPLLIGAIAVDMIWRRKRRPKDVLQAHGEAYVEATITRVVPVPYRVASILMVVTAVVVGYSVTTKGLHPSELTRYAASRACSSMLWAGAWGEQIMFVVLSQRHLARRIAKASDPALAMFSVPYVEPEAERSTIGEPAGVGWILRTAGLVMVGLISFIVLIGVIFSLPSGKDTGVLLICLVVAGPIFALVVRAFVRRFKRQRVLGSAVSGSTS